MKRNILKKRRRLKGSMIKESWRRNNEEKEVKKKPYYSDKFYVKWGITVSLLCIARYKLLNDPPCLDTSVEVPSVHRQKAATK
jgi:hypothetical protein